MKYILILGLLMSCATNKKDVAKKTNEKIRPEKHLKVKPKQERIISCVERFMGNDVEAQVSYDICKDLFSRRK